MNELTIPDYRRDLADVTRDIHAKTGEFLRAAIEIGRLLFEAKAMVAPGSWSRYIEEELPFSHSWANNYMKLYTEFGSDQTSLFGDSQAYMSLKPSQALEIIRLPEGQREEFMETHDVENMSSRELKAAIDELKNVTADLQAAEADLEEARAEIEDLKNTAVRETERFDEKRQEDQRVIHALKTRAEVAEREKEKAEKNAEAKAQRVTQLNTELETARTAEKIAREELDKALKNPSITEDMMEQLRREAEARAAEEATAEIRKKLATAETALQAAERARTDAEAREKDAREKLAAAQGSAKIQNPNLMAINVLGKQTIVTAWNTIQGHRLKAVEADPENDELVENFLVKLLCKLIRTVDGLWEELQKAMADG